MKKICKIVCWVALSAVALQPVAQAQKIMTLKDCVDAARQGNSQVKDAQYDVLMADELRKYMKTKYYPTVSASFSHFESTDYLVSVNLFDSPLKEIVDIILDDVDIYKDGGIRAIKRGTSAGLSLLQPIYTGGRLRYFNKLAKLNVEARTMMKDVVDDNVVQTTEFLYYKVVEFHETDKLLESMEKEVANIHQDAVNIYENGIVNKNDVLSVELVQDQLSALRVKAANGCKLLRRALAKYIGMADEDIDVDMNVEKDIVPPETLQMNTAQAVEARTETQLLDIWADKASLERKISRGSMLPVVLLGGSANYSKYIGDWKPRAIAFATVQMPISAFWSERHLYKRSKIAEQKALDFRQDKRELITLQVQDAYDNLESSYRQTQIAAKSIARAEENLRINREHYRAGMSNMTSLLEAQRQQQQAQMQYNSAICEYMQAKTRYLILTGRRQY
ncbi:MAG: TolC family protein [Prevotella sp.]|nr:TolC family protein [Prevotella sp.]